MDKFTYEIFNFLMQSGENCFRKILLKTLALYLYFLLHLFSMNSIFNEMFTFLKLCKIFSFSVFYTIYKVFFFNILSNLDYSRAKTLTRDLFYPGSYRKNSLQLVVEEHVYNFLAEVPKQKCFYFRQQAHRILPPLGLTTHL